MLPSLNLAYDLTEDLKLNVLVGNNVNQVSYQDVGYTGTNLIADGIFKISNTANVVADFNLNSLKKRVCTM